MNKANHFGVRWDENEEALNLDDRLSRVSPSNRNSIIHKILTDDHFVGNIARAASAYVCYKLKNPGEELIKAAIKNHRYLLQDDKWLDTFGEDRNALVAQLRKELDCLVKQASKDSVTTFASPVLEVVAAIVGRHHVRGAKTKRLSAFSEVSYDALRGVIDNDTELQQTKIAVEKAMKDAERGIELSVERLANLYVPFVKIVTKRYYESAGSGHYDWNVIFNEKIIKEIASQFAVEFISANQ
jgi:hypothetical protein